MYSRVSNNRGKGGGEVVGWLKLFQKLLIGGIGIMVGGKGVKKSFFKFVKFFYQRNTRVQNQRGMQKHWKHIKIQCNGF